MERLEELTVFHCYRPLAISRSGAEAAVGGKKWPLSNYPEGRRNGIVVLYLRIYIDFPFIRASPRDNP